jgi:DNA-binding transcriptional regulator LsrR (DeoR family)
VAAIAYKREPVLVAMKHGLANGFVVDEEIAEYILKQMLLANRRRIDCE